MGENIKNLNQQNHVKTKEFAFYLAAIFFYTMMTGIVGSYRQAYLVNVLALSDNQVSFYNGFLSIAGVPFIFYKLTGKTKEEVHEKVLKQREELESVKNA